MTRQRRFIPLVATAAVMVVFVSGPARAGDTVISALAAARSGTNINIAGTAVFAQVAPIVAGEDAATDAPAKMIGQELTQATIAMSADAKNVIFTLKIADQPPAEAGSGAPVVNYVWPIAVDGNDTGLALQAGRAGLNDLSPVTDPLFLLTQDGEGGFSTVGSLPGRMADGVVEWTVSMGSIGANPGSTISMGAAMTGQIQASPGAPGVVVVYQGRDTMFAEDVTLPNSVTVGIGPSTAADEDIARFTPGVLKSAGKFTASIPVPSTPGTYKIVAEACSEGDCALRSVLITI